MDPGAPPDAPGRPPRAAGEPPATPPHFHHYFYPILRERERIEGRRIAVQEVAEFVGVDREVVAYWAGGRSRSTSDRLLAGLCAYFGATPDDLLVAVPPGHPPPLGRGPAATARYGAYQFQGEQRRVRWRRAFYEVLWQRQAAWRRPIPVCEVAQAAGISDAALLDWAARRTRETADRLLDGVCAYLDCQPGDLLVPAEAVPAPAPAGGLLARLAALRWEGAGYAVPPGDLGAAVADAALRQHLAALPAAAVLWVTRSRAAARRVAGEATPIRVRPGRRALVLGHDTAGRSLVLRDVQLLPAAALAALASWIGVEDALLRQVLEWDGTAQP